jgi:alpha-methylacyl-CoA racemase
MGPLKGFKIIEIAGIGPGQLCGMLLADMGADVIRLERADVGDLGMAMPPRFNLMNRSRPTVSIDLKTEQGRKLVLRLCEEADALFEGYRPGVMERLGLCPATCFERNPRLVYGRMTGWGQEGPLADSAGHDPNYIGLAGALGCIGERGGDPVYPMNLIGDFGGGALYLAMGMLAAMLEASKSGKGQVVDAAMVDGVSSMMTFIYGLRAGGMWRDGRGNNVLDGGAPFARSYRTSDDKHVVIASIENRFFRQLLNELGLTDIDPERQHDVAYWPEMEEKLAAVFKTKTRDEWCDQLAGTDTCYAPVLDLPEVPEHPQIKARNTFVRLDGIEQPAPAPRFSRTHSAIQCPPSEHQPAGPVLRRWGLEEDEIEALALNP